MSGTELDVTCVGGPADGHILRTLADLYGVVRTDEDAERWLAGDDPWTIASLHRVGNYRYVELNDRGRTLSPLRWNQDFDVTDDFLTDVDREQWEGYLRATLEMAVEPYRWHLTSRVWIETARSPDFLRPHTRAARAYAWAAPDGPDSEPVQYALLASEELDV